MEQLLSLIFGLQVVVSGPALPVQYIPVDQWVPQKHDRLIADTAQNVGYIAHENGAYTSFPIGSGKRENVRYMGKSYYAATPSKKWTVKSTTTFKDRITFGKTGFFMRLYSEGTEYTSYGIHATDNIDDILASPDRYKSYGCILVSNDILELLAQTYIKNGHKLEVATMDGISSSLLAGL